MLVYKLGTHYPCPRAVLTGRHFGHPCSRPVKTGSVYRPLELWLL